MSQKDPLGDRMKQQYEDITRYHLPRRTYTILRVDGRAFHSVTKHLNRPFDAGFMLDMDTVARALCVEVQGAVFAYVQSDEVSVLLQDFESIGTQAWFGGNIQKMVSVAAGIATGAYGEWSGTSGHFDARVFTIPDPVEVANYFIWRQRDCVHNSILSAAQTVLGHSACQGLNTSQLQELMFQEQGVNWNDYEDGCKRGRVVVKVERLAVAGDIPSGWPPAEPGFRTEWSVQPAPHFTCNPVEFLARTIPLMPFLIES